MTTGSAPVPRSTERHGEVLDGEQQRGRGRVAQLLGSFEQRPPPAPAAPAPLGSISPIGPPGSPGSPQHAPHDPVAAGEEVLHHTRTAQIEAKERPVPRLLTSDL